MLISRLFTHLESDINKCVISRRGQITIPAELRRKARLRSRMLMSIAEENGRLVLIPFKRLLDEMQGS